MHDIDRPYIQFEHVSKSFGENEVLRDVSFDVKAGETVCILGRSGVGKSVSLHHIMGFLKPDSGRVWVAREDITEYSEAELERFARRSPWSSRMALCSTRSAWVRMLPSRCANEGICTKQQIYQVVDGLLEMVNVGEYRDQLPSGLSTGMKRSVAIARALAAQPEAILYDEPTTMVDPLTAHLLGDLIKKLKYQLKLTSIVVTHDMALAKKVGDRIVFLHEAQVVFFGTPAEMEQSKLEIVREFLTLDTLDLSYWRNSPSSAAPLRTE